MSTPTPEHARLDALVGTWIGEERLHGGVTGRTKSVAHRDMGYFVVADHYQERSDGRSYHNHLVYGYDEKNKRYTVVQYDSGGRGGDTHFGAWDGNSLTYQVDTPGGLFRYGYTFHGTDAYTFRFARSKDAGATWDEIVFGEFKRV
ncbi:MAG: DUF1579 family protein [Rhodospirillales bacterium]